MAFIGGGILMERCGTNNLGTKERYMGFGGDGMKMERWGTKSIGKKESLFYKFFFTWH